MRPSRPILAIVTLVLIAAGGTAVAFGLSRSEATASEDIGAFPMPGTLSASPRTQISLRGAPAGDLGTITVTGSRTGAHTGRLLAHSDGQGASFVPDKPFEGGEKVIVRTDLDIPGAHDGDYSFRTVARPKSGLQSDGSGFTPQLLRELTGQKGTPPKGAVARYKTRPDLRPPEIEVFKKATAGTAPGSIFIAPKKVFGVKARAGLQSGPMIVDNNGDPVWFAQNDKGNVTDFRVQTYQGKPVLTWWQGRAVLGTGEGVVQMVDTSFRPVATVSGGNGYKLDFHETTITPQNTLLGIVYNPVQRDLSKFGGSKHARVVDAVVQEIDIPTGLVMFEWHSLGKIGLAESQGRVPKGDKALYDYMHPNSVTLTPDGNILVSGREVWAAYELDHHTGALLTRFGGKRSDYKLLGASRFAWQHDVHMQPDGTLRIFDNEAAPRVRGQSRGLVLKLDPDKKTATVAASFTHRPDKILAGTQGDVQALPNGDMFVGWGSQGYFTEFSPSGAVQFDARIARGQDTYRAYRFDFTGTPTTKPSVVAEDGGRRVYASWNGATQVARWQVLQGSAPDQLAPAGSAARDGFETRIRVSAKAPYVAVQALDAGGNVLSTSEPVKARS